MEDSVATLQNECRKRQPLNILVQRQWKHVNAVGNNPFPSLSVENITVPFSHTSCPLYTLKGGQSNERAFIKGRDFM